MRAYLMQARRTFDSLLLIKHNLGLPSATFDIKEREAKIAESEMRSAQSSYDIKTSNSQY